MKSFRMLGLLAASMLPAEGMADDTTTTTADTSAYHDEDEGNGGGVGLGLHASTLGYGAELNVTSDEDLVWRLDYDYYSDYSYTTTKEDIRYDAHLHLRNYGI